MVQNNLSANLILHDLPTRFIGQRVLYYPKLTSTMDMARREAQRGAPEGTVVVADEQTAGRGRLKRGWLSPKGSIALSLILYPRISYLPYLPMLASLAVVRSIEAIADSRTQIKWPNDILIQEKKVCGILLESDVRQNTVVYAIIGIGINVNFRLADFPEIAPIATSLADELGRNIPRADLLRQLLVETEKLYLTLPDGERIYAEWRDKLVTLGKRVRVKSGEAIIEGIAESVTKDGNLMLRHADGRLMKIVAGDVTLSDY